MIFFFCLPTVLRTTVAELSSDHVAHKAKNTDYLAWKKFDDSWSNKENPFILHMRK